MPQAETTEPTTLDALIFGGGVAGLWTLSTLRRLGHHAALVETAALGQGQTLWSQGILHGGLKYTLAGLLTPSADAVADMPPRWHACLAGEAEPDLRAVRVRAPHCHIWRTDSLASRAGLLGARAGLRVRPTRLPPREWPPPLVGLRGEVHQLGERVIAPASLLAALAAPHAGRLLLADADAITAEPESPGLARVRIRSAGHTLALRARRLILTAGLGNDALRAALGLADVPMQRRPLHMVLARAPHLPVLNGHCVDGAATRVTITSDTAPSTGDPGAPDDTVWQIGGQIAEEGASLDRDALIRRAAQELAACVPAFNPTGVRFATYRADRAEPRTPTGVRPQDAFVAPVAMRGQAPGEAPLGIVAWPTKLVLAPRVADRVAALLPPPTSGPRPPAALPAWPAPAVADDPWNDPALAWTTA